jgi:CheY-like chemotaxis protein/signal transduction histidine kinase/HAMP domain-containing protein
MFRTQGSLRRQLLLPLLLFEVVSVLMIGLAMLFTYRGQFQGTLNLQQETAARAAKEIEIYLNDLQAELVDASLSENLVNLAPDQQKGILDRLQVRQSTYVALAIVDREGQELLQVAVNPDAPALPSEWEQHEALANALNGRSYNGPVEFHSGLPYMLMATPIRDPQLQATGMIVARVDLSSLWNIVGTAGSGESGYVYVVDRAGKLVAAREMGLVVRQPDVTELDSVQAALRNEPLTGAYRGLSDVAVIGGTGRVASTNWKVIAELPTSEAYAHLNSLLFLLGGQVLIGTGLAVGVWFYISRQVVSPILEITRGAQRIGEGDLDHQLEVQVQGELADLSHVINSTTAQLRDLVGNLEQRVADRTRRLEVLATIGGTLNAAFGSDIPLDKLVNQIKDEFGYYHAHIYLLDERGNLIVTAGTGRASAEMKRKGHAIPLNAPASLVAQAARTGEIVRVDDVQQAENWLPNPLLPDTCSEMSVPIMHGADGRVLGVFDVQQNRVAGLDDEDANLLRSLANQVAVALTNARLFEETLQAKEEAESAQKDIQVANQALEAQIWQTTGQAQLSDKMRGEQATSTLANNVIQQLCRYLDAQIGALYIAEEDTLNLVGSYAYASRNPVKQFNVGEGLVGQAALEKQPIEVTNVPDDYIIVSSGLGEIVPRHIMLCPFMYEDQVVGVVEMGTLAEFTPTQMKFLQNALTNIGITFNTAQARARIDELLSETQQQAEELQAQGEELRVMNEELEAQTESLRTSEAVLREKQATLDRQNRELKVAQRELEKKAKELALTSKYKSEFLANMSHELRTPLNSLLILARMLADNEEGNLTEDQVESAQVIYGSGNDLLRLINDILDLSKVEAGRMTFHIEPMHLTELVSAVRAQFAHVAEEKGLDLNITLADDLPTRIETDQQRAGQIVKNLLSNAFKFTETGSVSLDIHRPDAGVDLSRSGLDPAEAIAIRVADTGIGIDPEQQKIVFEAFQQADGGANRRYGGTGLGLSISRELAAKLGGQIDLESEPGQGSTFTLYLPIAGPPDAVRQERGAEEIVSLAQPSRPSIQPYRAPDLLPPAPPDDRDTLGPGDRVLLIVEDDPKFAQIVCDYAREKGFQCLIAGDGKTGLGLVQTYRPTAIILDLNLPDISGWEVLEVLKYDPDTRHIPVHIMSVDEEALHAYRKGAMGYLTKPVSREGLAASFQTIEQFISREIKTLLLVEDDARSRRSIQKLLGGNDVQIVEADGGRAALDLLKARHFDCMILDLNLPDMSGFEVLNEMDENETFARCPVIVYTGRDLTPEENLELMQYADSVIVKGVKSPERLLDETALFLHRVVADMPKSKQQTIKQLYTQDTQLEGKKILIVDDDMRNSFALSKLLSDKGMAVEMAQTGQRALELLAENGDIDLVLMDIMMPGMDGYETTRRIRAKQEFRTLPILALTAKAMKGDREKCLEAGADDYLPKPVDVDRLFSMLRVWLYQ